MVYFPWGLLLTNGQAQITAPKAPPDKINPHTSRW
jgi:hypothetical protein